MKKKGFTLIELVAVIGILAIIVAIAAPRVISYIEKSRKVAVVENAKIIYDSAEQAYTNNKLNKAGTEIPLVGKGEYKDFGVVQIDDAIESLKQTGIISKEKDFSNITDYRNGYYNEVLLRDLKCLINTPIDDISVYYYGNLAGYFDLIDGKVVYINDKKVHR